MTDAAGAAIHRSEHFAVLDGWRALSILFVLAGHWLPLGPASWQMNAAIAASGMAIFFTLSGFLITYFLLNDDRAGPFLLKRLARIVPLAWAAMAVIALMWSESRPHALANFLFVANLTPDTLMRGGHHLWSLCVEMQFYVCIAVLVFVGGRRALYSLPFLCLAVTIFRIADGEVISIVTWHRVDEILVGGCVALWWHHYQRSKHWLTSSVAWLPVVALVCLITSANPHSQELGYLRPYFAAIAVGGSLLAFPSILNRLFTGSPARYIAQISYALYVVHGVLGETVLGGQDQSTLVRYLLRVPLVLLTWLLAHLSTRYFEARFSRWARRRLEKNASAQPLATN